MGVSIRTVASRGVLGLGFLLSAGPTAAQSGLTGPNQALGFTIGDDYHLATYTQLTDWWKKLDGESDRMRLVSIGKTAEGRDQWMAIITSPANFTRLERYQAISARLARAEGLTPEQARALAQEGKSVVWIDGGLHATEVLGAHQLMEHVWQMVSQNDPETLRILDDVIQLVVHANPDGMELVSSWYMRRAEPTERSTSNLPRLYQKYVGHDNNRDFYMNAMPESENMSRVMYREWFPQIMYNHHQTGPSGAVLFVPPFRDPHNHNLDPLLVDGITLVGAAMHTRLAAEGKAGAATRNGASYQTWWNGGLRTAAYFHNMIGILTETIGNPTPIEIPFVPSRQLSTGDLPFPIEPQTWHFRQSVDYSITNNRAILDLASRYRETLLYNFYLMGGNSIEKGQRDSWTTTPAKIAAVEKAVAEMGEISREQRQAWGRDGADPALYRQILRNPDERDPRGYVIPIDQPDFPTATKFVNALLKSGVDVHRATQSFSVDGKRYGAGSWVVKTAQAFRPHVLDMFEPQNYPNDFPYPGGPPRAPYDNAGYTLALQMGVQFDRILESFDGPFEKVTEMLVAPSAPAFTAGNGYLISRTVNDGFRAVNRLLAGGQRVVELTAPLEAGGKTWPVGTWYVAGSSTANGVLRDLVAEIGLPITTTSSRAPSSSRSVQPLRVGLYDQYGGSMPSGWVRWILEQFEFPAEVVYTPRLDAGDLRKDFDVLVFVDASFGEGGGGFGGNNEPPDDVQETYRHQVGRVTAEKTGPKLRAFLDAGGRVVAIGRSTNIARELGLPIENHLVERQPDGATDPLPRDKFYIPASLLKVRVDPTAPSALGMGEDAVVLFNNDPVLRLPLDALSRGIRPVAWFPNASALVSGWAWGQTYLEGGVAAAEVTVGAGTLFLFGPEITFRSQPHGTYKFLFNALLGG
jgi:hypothetical protein